MVELVLDWLEARFDVTEVHHPARLRAKLAGQVQLDPERMPM